jgi:hypothetical protein
MRVLLPKPQCQDYAFRSKTESYLTLATVDRFFFNLHERKSCQTFSDHDILWLPSAATVAHVSDTIFNMTFYCAGINFA